MIKHLIIFILLLLSISLVSGGSIIQTDSYPQSGDGCVLDCGSYDDSELWIGGYGCFDYRNPSVYVDVVCADVDDDGILESCIYDSVGRLNDCIAQYPEIDDIDNSYFYNVGDLDGGGWGVYDCDLDGAISLGADYLIDPTPNIYGAVDSDFSRNDLLIQFYEYYDCDDGSGKRDVNDFSLQEYQIFDEKGIRCRSGFDGGEVVGFTPFDDSVINIRSECYYLDTYSGQDLSYCDDGLAVNSSNSLFEFSSNICSLNFTVRDDFIFNQRFNCYNGVLDSNLNETDIDYGGWCGNCSHVFADDNSFYFASLAFDGDKGKRTPYNPFDPSYCPVGDGVSLVPVIFLLLGGGILLLLIVLLALILLFYAIFIGFIISVFKSYINKFIKKKIYK